MKTADLSEVAFPEDAAVHDEQRRLGHGCGTFAGDSEPFEPLPDDPQVLMSAEPRATILVHPDDVLALRRHPDPRRLNGCCRLDGLDGPNLVCGSCGAEIATEQSDCWVAISVCSRTRSRQSRSIEDPRHAERAARTSPIDLVDHPADSCRQLLVFGGQSCSAV